MTPRDLFEDAIDKWKESGFKGTIVVPKQFDTFVLLNLTLDRIYTKNNKSSVLIATNFFTERSYIVERLTHQESEELSAIYKNAISSGDLKIVSSSILSTTNNTQKIFINYGIKTFDQRWFKCIYSSKYNLTIIDAPMCCNDVTKYYKYSPPITAFTEKEISEVRVSTPIEEISVGLTIPEGSEASNLLKYYNDYIATSLNIFGSFDNMEKARTGNKAYNTSAVQICYQIAKDNGWDEHLDMSYEFNVQLDALFNPNNILDRAYRTYEIIRERTNLLASYEPKIDSVINIIEENPYAKILIINKRGEFAAMLTDKINGYFGKTICGDYHDKLDKIPAIDDRGKIQRVKSGKHSGEPKMIGAMAQCSLNQEKFLNGKLNILSTSNLPSPKLAGVFDIIIITSPTCEDFETYLYRLNDVRFSGEKVRLYSIYVKNSLESVKLLNKKRNANHTLIYDDNFNVNSENNLAFVIVD